MTGGFVGRKSDLTTIQHFLEDLSSLGVSDPVDTRQLYRHYELNDSAGMLSEIKHILGLPCQLLLGTVNSGGPKRAAAWVVRPAQVPLYGTSHFRTMRATINIRKDFLQHGGFETIIHTLAHECCHLILDSTRHELQKEERAVDLLVMMRGFSEMTLSVTGGRVRGMLWELLGGFAILAKQERDIPLGYLTTTEAEYAHSLILKMRKRKRP